MLGGRSAARSAGRQGGAQCLLARRRDWISMRKGLPARRRDWISMRRGLLARRRDWISMRRGLLARRRDWISMRRGLLARRRDWRRMRAACQQGGAIGGEGARTAGKVGAQGGGARCAARDGRTACSGRVPAPRVRSRDTDRSAPDEESLRRAPAPARAARPSLEREWSAPRSGAGQLARRLTTRRATCTVARNAVRLAASDTAIF